LPIAEGGDKGKIGWHGAWKKGGIQGPEKEPARNLDVESHEVVHIQA